MSYASDVNTLVVYNFVIVVYVMLKNVLYNILLFVFEGGIVIDIEFLVL